MAAIYKVSGNDVINNDSQFVGAYSKGMAPALKLLSIGDATTVSIASSSGIIRKKSSVKLSNNNFLYLTRTNTSFICALVTVDSSYTITAGNSIAISPSGITSTNTGMLERLSDTSALLLIADSGALRAVVLTVSGSTVSANTLYTLDTPVGTGNAQLQDLARISPPSSPTRFLVSYAVPNASNLYETKITTIDVSGTVVTANTAYSIQTSPTTALRTTLGLHDIDSDVATGYDFFCTEPITYTGTWSRDDTGLVTITVTDLALNFAFSAYSKAYTSAYITYTSGDFPPSSVYARLYITGSNTGTYQLSSSASNWNTPSSGNCEVTTTFLYSRSFDISGTTITNISASGSGRKIDIGLATTSTSSDITVYKTGEYPYIGQSSISTDKNYLLLYRKIPGEGLFNSPFGQGNSYLTALSYNNNIWAQPGVTGGVYAGQHISYHNAGNHIIDMNRNTIMTLFMDTSVHYVTLSVYDTASVGIRRNAFTYLENTIREIALYPKDIIMPSRPLTIDNTYPLKSMSEVTVLNRTNQIRGSLFPLADPTKFLHAYGTLNGNWLFRIFTFDKFM